MKDNDSPVIKEKSVIFNIIVSLIYSALLIGVIYIIPEPYRQYVARGYGAFLLGMSFVFLVTYLVSFFSPDYLDKNMDRTVKKRLKNDDFNFIRKTLNPSLLMLQTVALSSILIVTGIIGGNLFGSVFFMVAFLIWSAIYFLTVERINTRMHSNHRKEILEYINNKEDSSKSTNRQ